MRLRSSRVLHSVECFTDIWGQLIGPIFEGQEVEEEKKAAKTVCSLYVEIWRRGQSRAVWQILRLLKVKHSAPPPPPPSGKLLDDALYSSLRKGFSYAVAPTLLPIEDTWLGWRILSSYCLLRPLKKPSWKVWELSVTLLDRLTTWRAEKKRSGLYGRIRNPPSSRHTRAMPQWYLTLSNTMGRLMPF